MDTGEQDEEVKNPGPGLGVISGQSVLPRTASKDDTPASELSSWAGGSGLY